MNRMPKIPKKMKDHRVDFRLSTSDLRRLKRLARLRKTTLSEAVRRAVAYHLACVAEYYGG